MASITYAKQEASQLPVLEAETDRLADVRASQVRIGIRGWRRGSTQNLDRREGCRVGHPRQIDQFLYCPAPKQQLDVLVFASHLLLCRVVGPLDADMSEVVEDKQRPRGYSDPG